MKLEDKIVETVIEVAYQLQLYVEKRQRPQGSEANYNFRFNLSVIHNHMVILLRLNEDKYGETMNTLKEILLGKHVNS